MPACEDILCSLDSSVTSSSRRLLSLRNNARDAEPDSWLLRGRSRATGSRRAASTSLPPLKTTSSSGSSSTDPRHLQLQPRMSLHEEREQQLLESEHRSIVAAASLASCRAGSIKRDIGIDSTVQKDNRPRTSDSLLLRSARGPDKEIPEVHTPIRPSRRFLKQSLVRTRCKSVDSRFPSDGGAEEDDLAVLPSSSSWSLAYPSSAFSVHDGNIANPRHSFDSARRKSVDDIGGSGQARLLVSQSDTAAQRCSSSHAQWSARQYRADHPAAFLNDPDEKVSSALFHESESAPDIIARPTRTSRAQQNLRAVASVATLCASARRSKTKKKVSWSDDMESCSSLHLPSRAAQAIIVSTASKDIQQPPTMASDDVVHDVTMRSLGMASDDVVHDITMRSLGEILPSLDQSAAEREMLDAIEKSLSAMAGGCDGKRLTVLQGLLSRVFSLSKADVDILVKMAKCNSITTETPAAITPQKLRLVLSYVSSYQSQTIDDTCLQILEKTPTAAAICLRVLAPTHDSTAAAAARPVRHSLDSCHIKTSL